VHQPPTAPSDTDDPEAIFRRDVARVLDEIWQLRVADEAMAALFRVIQKGRRQAAADEAERGPLPE
jgi:hypothetical protein